MLDIIELQHRLEATNSSNEETNNYSRVRARIANRNKDIDMLLKRGTTPLHVSEILGIPIELVQPRVAELEKDDEDRRRFMQTMELPKRGGYVAIFR
jgi:hypothetical protein